MGNNYDIAIIGGGPAGYTAAIKAAQLGGKVVLFEKEKVGGTCLNRGCIPTKNYLKTAEILGSIKKLKNRGIVLESEKFAVNMTDVVKSKNEVVTKLTGGIMELLKSNGVDVIFHRATVIEALKIEADGQIYRVKKIILASGSKSSLIPIDGINSPGVLTSEELLNLEELPKELIVLGGGVIGCELASVFSAFGSEVTILEAAKALLPHMDEDISRAIKRAFKKEKVKVLLNQRAIKIELKNEKLVVTLENGKSIEGDKILISVGRNSDLDGLGIIKDEIKCQNGSVVVNDKMETNIQDIYAVGDMNGRVLLAHAAFKMGEVAAINAMGGNGKVDVSCVPSCLYTHPEAASVGLTETEASERCEISTGNFYFRGNGRALASDSAEGFVKVIVDKKYGELLGVHMVCEQATEMISEAASLKAMEITAHEIAEIIHPHPTYSEAFMEACADAVGQSIHLPKE